MMGLDFRDGAAPKTPASSPPSPDSRWARTIHATAPPTDSRGEATKLARGRYTLLIVEDDAAMRELVRDTLSEEGFVVETAGRWPGRH